MSGTGGGEDDCGAAAATGDDGRDCCCCCYDAKGKKMDLGLEEMLAPRSRLMLPGAAQGRWWCLRDLRFQP